MKVFQTVHDTWMISETTRLFGLTLTENGRITAPEGKLVTLVYNGENIPLLPGQYEGDVVLEVTDAIRYQDTDFRAAVALVDGKYVPEQSVTAAAVATNSIALAFWNRKKRGDPLFLRLNSAVEAFLLPVKPYARAE